MESLIGDQQPANTPWKCACPVCGKWGRKKYELDHRGYTYDYFYCNPKARKGGKGCGEKFNILDKQGACKRIADKVLKMRLDESKQPRLIALGHEMVAFMKSNGLHKPFERKVLNRELHRPFIDHKKQLGICP